MRTSANMLLVSVLVLLVTPGLIEAAENVWHLAVAGHTAHSPDAGADHQPTDDEHGCTGSFHLCSCHRTPPSQTEARAHLGSAHLAGTSAAARERAPGDDPCARGVDHVPRL
jgi:hypothetical protein